MDDDGARHLRGDDRALEERPLIETLSVKALVDVRALERELGVLEAETDARDIPRPFLLFFSAALASVVALRLFCTPSPSDRPDEPRTSVSPPRSRRRSTPALDG